MRIHFPNVQQLWKNRRFIEGRTLWFEWLFGGIVLTSLPLLTNIVHSMLPSNNPGGFTPLEVAAIDGDILLMCTGVLSGPIIQCIQYTRKNLLGGWRRFMLFFALCTVLAIAFIFAGMQSPGLPTKADAEIIMQISLWALAVSTFTGTATIISSI